MVADFASVLADAADHGADGVYLAADLFRRLVGEAVWVDVEIRSNRKRGVVQARFTPALAALTSAAIGTAAVAAPTAEVVVWLRTPPQMDRLADEARRLYEVEEMGLLAIGRRLQVSGQLAYQSYKRYEMRGQPVPARRPPGRYKRSG